MLLFRAHITFAFANKFHTNRMCFQKMTYRQSNTPTQKHGCNTHTHAGKVKKMLVRRQKAIFRVCLFVCVTWFVCGLNKIFGRQEEFFVLFAPELGQEWWEFEAKFLCLPTGDMCIFGPGWELSRIFIRWFFGCFSKTVGQCWWKLVAMKKFVLANHWSSLSGFGARTILHHSEKILKMAWFLGKHNENSAKWYGSLGI